MNQIHAPQITFTRLSEIAPAAIATHMSDPVMSRHMPLLDGKPWDEATARAFVTAKEARWQADGLGHWAFLADGRYVGWGGFQREDEDWDFGLVLTPDAFGLGQRITRLALEWARADGRIPYVTFLLPPSRRHLGGLRRLGATQIGEVMHDGARFLKFRLETA